MTPQLIHCGRPAGPASLLRAGGHRAIAPAGETLMHTLLIVDDESSNSEPLEALLQENGYRVFTAVNGQDGLDRMDEVAPELVILDFMMPVMNGGELGRRLRANQATRRIPILMNSGTSEATVRADFSGYDAFLRKPFKIDELLSMVRDLLAASAKNQ